MCGVWCVMCDVIVFSVWLGVWCERDGICCRIGTCMYVLYTHSRDSTSSWLVLVCTFEHILLVYMQYVVLNIRYLLFPVLG